APRTEEGIRSDHSAARRECAGANPFPAGSPIVSSLLAQKKGFGRTTLLRAGSALERIPFAPQSNRLARRGIKQGFRRRRCLALAERSYADRQHSLISS